MAANMNNNTVKYKFQNQDDLLFYILNAAGHDFIHDFNNYGRMGKILNYIMGLVEHNKQKGGLGDSEPEYEEEPGTAIAVSQYIESRPEIHPVIQENLNDNPDDNSTLAISTSVLEESQQEDFFSNEPIQYINIADTASDTVEGASQTIQDITNRIIEDFNSLSTGIDSTGMETRSITKKLNVLQRLKDFIQESKFLIISKLHDSIPDNQVILASQDNSDNSPNMGLEEDRMELEEGGAKRIKRQKGGNGINIITKNNIVQSIKDIIEEIKEATPQNLQLISFFEYIMFSYLNLSIPGISPLEIFNNSLIEDSASIFIIGQCNNTNIREQAKLCLKALVLSSSTKQNITNENRFTSVKAKGLLNPIARGRMNPIRINLPSLPTRHAAIAAAGGGNKIFVGGAFNGKTYSQIDESIWNRFEASIETFKQGGFYQTYKYGTLTYNLQTYQYFYEEYNTFITSVTGIIGSPNLMELIVGKQMLSVKTTIIRNKYDGIGKSGRNAEKNIQEMVDTIVDLIIVKTIDVYNDIKNRQQAISEDSGDGGTIKGSAKTSVQRVSRLLATKILELTGSPSYVQDNPSDLNAQISILNNIARNDKGYTNADDLLISHFINKYANTLPNILSGPEALAELDAQLNLCQKTTCRVINNAVPTEIKSKITNIVVCPTSSVCDGMGSFGSCVNPKGNKEYANMNFSVTFGDESNYYYGQTNIKPDLTSVNINYGIKYNNLEIYNFIDIKIDSQPIILQANYVFKNLINRIIEIWKGIQTSNIEGLWEYLYRTDYFLSILKLGSQKAVGDIFQEINSTLINGGYNFPVQLLNVKKTYGLMGDRPSGVRVFKLLTGNPDGQGKNPKASGGYVGGDTSFVYFSQVVGTSGTIYPKPNSLIKPRQGNTNVTSKTKMQNEASLKKSKQDKTVSARKTARGNVISSKRGTNTATQMGGNKITKKRKHKITHKYYKQRINKTRKIKK